MKELKTGFYIDRNETLWVVFPNNTRFFLSGRGTKWEWEKSYSSYLESTRKKYLGDME